MSSSRSGTVDWSNNINLLRDKLISIIGNSLSEADAAILFDQESMLNYWVPAFTHRSKDNDENYELLESYGDTVLDLCLSMYARKMFGDENLSEQLLNDLKDQYMSEENQSLMLHNLGLGDYIRMDRAIQLNKKMEEDVFESMFGALNNVVDDRIQFGLGYIYCFNLFRHIFSTITIDLSTVKKNEITQLKELFEALYLGLPVYDKVKPSTDPAKGAVMTTVRLQDGSKLAEGYGNETKKANLDAARAALQSIKEKQGWTLESAQKYKMQKELQNLPELAAQIKRLEGALGTLNERAKAGGQQEIVDYKLEKATGTAKSKYGVNQTTFALKVAFRQPDGSYLWRSLEMKTGQDPNLTRIQLAKDFADNVEKSLKR